MIRAAEKDDAEAMGLLRRRAVRVAYDGFVNAQQLDEQEDTSVWERRIGAAPEGSVWVWEQDGKVAGFVAALPEAQDQPGVGFLQALYVDPVAQGAGVGRALHDKALERLRDGGVGEATLWVLADNARGRAFFEGLGWEKEPEIEDNDPDFATLSYRYRRAL
jgi:ribosomal protein S18 acetylase RimI-like enzyme